MKKSLLTSGRGPDKRSSQPRHIEEILDELIITSNEPFYKGYREFLASKEKDAEKGEKDNE